MNILQALNNKNTIDSLEVAEMLDKEHSELLKEIEGRKDGKNVGIIPVLLKGNFHVNDYYIASTYKDSRNRSLKCYEITKMGCEILGNKQQGEKGILFTAKYVDRFNQMEQRAKKGLTPFEELKLHYKAIEQQEEDIKEIKEDIDIIKNDSPLFTVECQEIQSEVKKKGTKILGGKNSLAYKDKSLRSKLYSDIQGQLKREFGVSKYAAIKRKYFKNAIETVRSYRAPAVLIDEITVLNNQLSFEVK